MGVVSGANIDNESIVVNLDACNIKSYPGSGTTWYDISGYSNNGTLENSPTYSPDNKGYFSLDGINDVITIPHSANLFLTTTFSIEMWIRVDTNGDEFLLFANKRGAGDGNATFIFGIDNRKVVRTWNPSGTDGMVLFFYFGNGSTTFPIWSKEKFGTTDGDNEWHHTVATLNTSTKETYLYYDGELVDSGSYTGTLAQNSTTIRLGNEYNENSNDYPMNGDIGLFRIYNKELSATEVLQNYNSTKSRYI